MQPRRVSWLVLALSCAALAIAKTGATLDNAPMANMNGPYVIANGGELNGVTFSTDYSTKNAEFFDVYSPPIRTRYGEVFWTLLDPVPLPQDIVQRFAGKTMAVIGYESDQVRKTPDGDVSVPITWAYNHHYIAYLMGANSKLVKADPKTFLEGEFSNMYDEREFYVPQDVDGAPGGQTPDGVMNAHLFSEGNGGEYRKTFHGYPKGYASLLFSPSTFSFMPMQIDTHNRDHPGADFVAGPLPKASQAPPNASYSGLLECPCTDRIVKKIKTIYSAITKDTCPTVLTNATECYAAAVSMGASAKAPQSTVSEKTIPSGCSIVRTADGSETIYFNTEPQGAACGGGSQYSGKAMALNKSVSMSISLDATKGQATITLSGPSEVWFGVGLNAQAMSDLPYAIIVNGSGQVQERKLANHDPGVQIADSITVTSNTVNNGVRTLVMTRPMKGATANHFTFAPADQSTLPFISAIGSGPVFTRHKFKGVSSLSLTALDGVTCVCDSGKQGSINGIPFHKDCWPEPYGDLIQMKNPTCFVDAYAGGLRCCHHQWILLDQDQNPWPNQIDEYSLKFRFWFQEYNPTAPKHVNLVRIHWQTEVMSTEYDVPRKSPETPPENAVHQITSRWKVGQMMHKCDVRQGPDCTGLLQNKTGIKLIYVGAHCHAPSCLSQELYNADTGQLLCRHIPVYGRGTEPFDEKDYLAIPPCLFGSPDEGLPEPVFLSFDTDLISIKRNNNTYGHYGEMALLQMKGIVV